MKYTHQDYPAWRYSGTPEQYESRLIKSADEEQSGWVDSPANLTVKQPEVTKADLLQVAADMDIEVDKRWSKAKIAAALGVE